MLEMFVRSTAIRLLLNSSRCTRERLSLGGFSPRNTGAACARFHNATSLRSAGRDLLETYKESFSLNAASITPAQLHRPDKQLIGQEITVHGFVGKRRDLSDRLSFVNLSLPDFAGYKEIQIVSQAGPAGQDVTKDRQNVHEKLKGIKPHSAVSLTGVLSLKRRPKGKETPSATEDALSEKDLEIQLRDVQCLASFPDDIIVSDDAQFGPETRHLQMRFDRKLADRIRFRSQLLQAVRQELSDFSEVETPILFKSTPEGAREFLVPTRRPGYSYALPQSPQQYKQILMASGMHRYFQVAKCFRDEDLRADRQPEFTQIDMEMAFAGGEDVMRRIEELVRDLCERLHGRGSILSPPKSPFQRVSYTEAMALYGSDKPDLRIPDAIISVDSILPEALIGMMTSLSNPVIDSWKIRLNADTSEVRKFLQEFMDSAEGMEAQKNPDGPPGIFIYDPRKPLEGLQAFGFEGLEAIKDRYIEDYPEDVQEDGEPFTEGDLIILQARPRQRFYGGSTALGRLRTALHKSAVSKGLSPRPTKDEFLWVVDFPLFTPNNGIDPGQGGTAGFSATHHPFTAPKTAEDVDLLLSDPLAVTADHYDLVLNGVELGGGSRRIHNSEMQQFVMRDILKMSEERLRDFSHLFEALRAGCPPHAGIALGLDRLVAMMVGVESVRDVIAFPKSGRGEDLLVGSPTLMSEEQQETYHISVKK